MNRSYWKGLARIYKSGKKAICLVLTVMVLMMVAVAPASAADALDTWSVRSSGGSADLHGVAFGNNVFVAVAHNGAVMRSTDGTTWFDVATGTTHCFWNVTYGGSKFVAVGNHGTIFTSTNGTIWHNYSAAINKTLVGVSYGNGRYVVSGDDGTILTSTDAEHWASCPSPVTSNLTCTAYGDGIFLIAGANGIVLRSPNGITWTKQNTGVTKRLGYVAFGDYTFVVVGEDNTILTTKTGVVWYKRTSAIDDPTGVTYGNNMFVMASVPGHIQTSPNGVTWTKRTTPPSEMLHSLAYGKNTFVAVGNHTTILQSASTFVVGWVMPPGGWSWIQSSNADLGGLSINQGTLSPSFAAATTNYTAAVDNSVTSINVTASVYESHAKITVNGNAANSGQPYGPVALNLGDNQINVKVTAQNGIATKTYTINVNRSAGASSAKTICFYVGSTDYYVNGGVQTMDVAPMVVDGRTLLPVKYVADPLGAATNWDPVEKKVTITMNSTTIELWINKNMARVNGAYSLIDPMNPSVSPMVVNPGRTMLPLRFITETLGCGVTWDPNTKEAKITYPKP
ncbi:MAG: stalk domain-containing protein [Acidobacteriota bacterium]